MTKPTLPPVAALVPAEAADALPGRLRKRLDAVVVGKVADWPIDVVGQAVLVHPDPETTVTLPIPDGFVRSAAEVTCSCLLAPNCLHRAAVLARCPVVDEDDLDLGSAHPGEESTPRAASASAPTAAPGEGVADQPCLTGDQLHAARQLWTSASQLLATGMTGFGALDRAQLLRAAHHGRAYGLHRAAAAARRLAGQLQSAAEHNPQFRLDDVIVDLTELLLVTHRLRGSTEPAPSPGAGAGTGNGTDTGLAELLGRARAGYDHGGGLRLFGLCTVPVVAGSEIVGVLTYVVDRDGKIYGIADLTPPVGDHPVARASTTIKLGDASFSHHDLARAGLTVSGATVSEIRQLGAGRAVRAVRAEGVPWSGEPLAGLWREPLSDQIPRALQALDLPVKERPVGADLVFVKVEVIGSCTDGTVAVLSLPADPAEPAVADSAAPATADRAQSIAPDGREGTGTHFWLTAPADHQRLPYWHNLSQLGHLVGATLLIIGRPDPGRPACLQLLAAAPAPAPASTAPSDEAMVRAVDPELRDVPTGPAWILPEDSPGHADLGFHRIHHSRIRGVGQSSTRLAPPGPQAGEDPVLVPLRRLIRRVVTGGRVVESFARSEAPRLSSAGLITGAMVVDQLQRAAPQQDRDVFGRLTADDGSRFSEAWLVATVYARAAARTMIEASWSPVHDPPPRN